MPLLNAVDVDDLASIVAAPARAIRSSDPGPRVLVVAINGMAVGASWYQYKEGELGSIDTQEHEVPANLRPKLLELVENLVKNGEAFTVISGNQDDVISLKWELLDEGAAEA